MNNRKGNFRRIALIIVSFLPGLLILALPFYRPDKLPVLFLFLGRFHPLVLHFPIVLILLALLAEIARRFHVLKASDNVVKVILVAAAVSTLASVGAGFFLFASGDYSGALMEQHFWAGAITGAAIFTTVALFFLYRSTSRFYAVYLGSLLVSNAAVGYASHLGGSITHGPDYLSEYIPALMSDLETDDVKPESEMLVYEDMLAPIFEAKCLSCHNTSKAKGDLLMTSYQNILKGGESDLPIITSGLPEKSELYHRIVLPEDHEDHMPPEGKTPLHADEIALLKFWITSGAKETQRVEEVRGNKEVQPVVESLLKELARYRRKSGLANMKVKELQRELDEVAGQLSITVHRDSAEEGNFFSIAMKFPPTHFTNEHFRALSPYYEVFSKASLVSSAMDDDGLYYIGQMTNLKKLYLQKTGLDGSGLIYLQNLPNLEVLNLSFTKTDDKAALDLLKIPNLREVYLYRTNTSKEVIEALRKNKPGLKILLEEGPYF